LSRQFLNLEFIEAAKLMDTHINASRDNYKNTRERGEREREGRSEERKNYIQNAKHIGHS